jgi:hypothetical protein
MPAPADVLITAFVLLGLLFVALLVIDLALRRRRRRRR